jgi:hypothetical protein
MPKIHQVFVGCPFRSDIRANYDRLKREIEAETPLAIVLADTGAITSTNYLLQHITEQVRDSAGCIFDATGGNPNVSLEVGIAHALGVDYLLAFKTRKPRTAAAAAAPARTVPDVKPIISDLQGKHRVEYKRYSSLRRDVEKKYLEHLPYMKRWVQFRDAHRDMVSYVLQLFAQIRTSGRSQRPRLTAILDGSGFTTTQVSQALRQFKLIVAQRGQQGGYFYPTK